MRIKLGIKAWSLLSSLVFSLVIVAGCNTDEPAPSNPTPPPPPMTSKPATVVTPPAPPSTEKKAEEKPGEVKKGEETKKQP